jgi:hypothetical protein
MRRLVLFTVAGLLMAQTADRTGVNGQLWVNVMHETERSIYILGWVEGFSAASKPFVSVGIPNQRAVQQTVRQLYQCMEPMRLGQIQAIINKYVNAHPEIWHEDIGVIAGAAMVTACNSLDSQ